MRVTRESFNSIYNEHKNTVYAVVYNYTRNTEDAQDLTQDTFIKLLESEKIFEDSEHLKAWLIRVAINSSKNHLKFKSRFSDEEIPELPVYDDHNESSEILIAVMSLPEKYRIPLHLFYYEDMTNRQISDILGIPEATVKIRLKRGRERLGKILKEAE